ncbi:MAG TPA: substrate-binding domain-containing protein, partial [Pedococcus sp.]
MTAAAVAAVPVTMLVRGSAVASDCPSTLPVTISVAEQIAPVVQAAAEQAREDGACAKYAVQSASPAAVAAAIAGGEGPDAWVSDSTLWIDQLRAAEPDLEWQKGTSIASSPIVVALPQPLAAKVGSARPEWKNLLSGPIPVRMADPDADATGRLSLFTVHSVLGTSKANRNLSGATLIRLSRTAAGSEGELFGEYAQQPDASPAFPASEQAVAKFNREHADRTLAAVIPSEGTAALDYPWTVAPRLNHRKKDLLDKVLQQLRSPEGAEAISRAGFRAAGGSGSPKVAGVPSGRVTVRKPLPLAQRSAALGLWAAVRTDMRMLAVMDVSGSMRAQVGKRTRIQLAQAAAGTALNSFPQTSQVGLWEFSTDRDGVGKDYRSLLPIRTLSDKVGDGTQKDALNRQFAAMTKSVEGNTGLYDTLLASYRSVKASYQPGFINSVVLMTDGVNEDSSGLSLEQLRAALKNERDSQRPVRVILIGLGGQTDRGTLERIAKTA